MNCEIIAVGTEVTTGDISNTNAAFLSRHLTSLGIEVTRQAAVDDNAARITEALAAAVSRSQIIIFTGGLGPTPDDLTKETVSAAVGRKLVKNEESLARIQSYYDARGSVMPEMNVKQAYFPEGCRIFPNHHGTADGCVIQSGNQHIIMLPGPPSELCPMFEESVREYLLALLDHTIVTKTLKVFGIGESSAAETISDLLERPSPTVATYVGVGGDVRIKVTAVGDRREDCEAQCEEAAGVIRERLGDKVYDDAGRSLPEVVIARLTEQNKKIATAESCTAGLLSKTLTDVSGASQVFEYGISAYANRVKTEMLGVRAELLDRVGAVSPEVAEAMARGARSAGKADLAIGITGVAGPDGGTAEKPVGLVYVCLFDGTWFFTRKLTLPPARGRDSIRITTVMNALDMVRLYLDSNPAFLQTGRDQNGAPPPAAPAAAAALASEEPASEEPASEEPAKAEEPSKVKAFLKSIFPWKGDSTGQKIRKIILIVCVVVFVCSAGYIIDYVYQSIRAHGNNERLTSLIDSNISELDENGINKRFYNLLEINPDTVGWLKVPNTKTDNPVVQAADNEKYLKTTFEGETSKYGAIFADSRNVFERGAVLSTNTILYGHHMKDGEMMGELKKYRDLDFYKANPWVEFTTIYSEQTTYWKVFSVFVINTRPADDNGHVFDYQYRQCRRGLWR